MSDAVREVVILGGGSAGWITAGLLAAEHRSAHENGLRITLIESPKIRTLGVGEGTWPTMRSTLAKIGIREADVFRECDAAFKQGAKFAKWCNGRADDFYCHPLVIPDAYGEVDHVSYWSANATEKSFADTVCFQSALCEAGLAPKQITTPEYLAVANYAYHLDSVKLGEFLKRHCVAKLGVKYIQDEVLSVEMAANGDIAALNTEAHGAIGGDLFVDCSGFASRLLGHQYESAWVDRKGVLFNDSALAVHVPYANEDDPIACHTISTAQSAGWVWDIGLPTRRGVGYVYSSAHTTEAEAEQTLRQHVASLAGEAASQKIEPRSIHFDPGHRDVFWRNNCVAVGVSAGFVEPLEASALVLIELSALMVSDNFPHSRQSMSHVAKKFNERFRFRWERIVDFLKLHYVLSERRDSDYWVDHCRKETWSDQLKDWLEQWQYAPPNRYDFYEADEVFSSASWQYVLYGMGFKTEQSPTASRRNDERAYLNSVRENQALTQRYLTGLPAHRELIQKICQHGLQKV